MATANLSAYNIETVPNAQSMRFGIVVSEWNEKITSGLLNGAKATLLKHGATEDNITIITVPGAFELPLGAQTLLENTDVEGVICLGCVIQGETKHFDFVCQGVTKGIVDVSINYNRPVIFGVLTDNNEQQSIDRSGGKMGNKGDEAAVTAIKMIDLQRRFEKKD
ncbi:6,7-dimethyl-8-ribityllumazine synthase [Acidiluteibacter ferrifornacis]|uniref:6,7-dimethyl-8-ribityllumazine synthase n=1 Tax=Acidiluteibacter ferrifornacis TaxID=2692424 RepID=A0A6N9NIJ1_9FLAO|nr:6,7-dimethyl-8-ribityllumazine synthase [Acidiluteibacter ferrifornacis]NBG65659.1 6,7-dimethyl-8-ribityllumazine synthase [Acidiluteibacter ferrifornacis]